MNINSNLICSFNQKLSYNDFLNFNNYINSKTRKNFSSKTIIKTKFFSLSIWLLLLIISLNTTNDIILLCVFVSAIFLLILNFLLNNYLSLLAKYYYKKSTEKKISLFKDFILYEPINKLNLKELDKYKFLTKNISEIILSSSFCAIKFNSKTILISLSSDIPEIKIMINYFKTTYSNKIIEIK